jgi:hypothetical protein
VNTREELLTHLLAPVQEALRCHKEQLDAAFAPLRDLLAPILEQVRLHQEALERITFPTIEAIQKAKQDRPVAVEYLMKRGWFTTSDYPDSLLIEVAGLIQAEDHSGIDAHMSNFARSRFEDTEQALRHRFLDRAQVFADAFEAHRAGKYTLSIPVLLAQVDGIGCEVLGIRRIFFRSQNRTDALEQKLSAFTAFGEPYGLSRLTDEMLYPLGVDLSIEEDTNERDKQQIAAPWFGPLNRHGVLHGLDTDYATEANSLRCVLLLRYLLDVDQVLHKDIPDQVAELNAVWQP